MEGFSLKNRAIAFAICAGAIAFILALAAASGGTIDVPSATQVLIAAIVCAVLCRASAERALATTAAAIDSAILRLAGAADGDLESDIPREVHENVPSLAVAMEGLFRKLRTNLNHVERLALYDPVTGLSNRTSFRSGCEAYLAAPETLTGGVLLFVDLDRFKAVNDTLGHAAGDALLTMVADRLKVVAARHGTALLGRLAGDEFTMFLPNLRDAAEAELIGHSIVRALSATFDLANRPVLIGASVGVAMWPEHGATLHDLMRSADVAMYHAKSQGRARVEFFSDALAAQIAERSVLEQDLRTAIEREQFALYFQPQVRASDGHIVAAEALLRWQHPTLGLRRPGSFLASAEESGLIVNIGRWVIDEIADTIARWEAAGIEQRLTVNISPRQLDHAQFFLGLRDALKLSKAPARLLELEITEAMAMQCSPVVIDAIVALRAEGATIAIDDFGTGYSNLTRLRDLPVDRIKLDRSLVEHVADRAEARTVAQAVIGLIHGLGCEAVAEGIESRAQADVLRVIGCDLLQGYALAQPMPETAFLEWCAQDWKMRKAG